ncbi:hypothetical protein [Bacteroides caecimuris]|uniref:hypothetical protein n=1 Tax=Bacteroides caecimuris TaxID=1796613 RepID=UPI00242F995C|nr:hypothetical protein [Bacteroides caecimuris]
MSKNDPHILGKERIGRNLDQYVGIGCAGFITVVISLMIYIKKVSKQHPVVAE